MQRNTWIIVVVVIALLLLCCCVGLVGLYALRAGDNFGNLNNLELGLGRVTVSTSQTRQVPVDLPATLTVHNFVGEIEVNPGSGSEMLVDARIEARAGSQSAAQSLADQVSINVTGTGSEPRIDVSMPTGLTGNRMVTVALTITVPQGCSFHLSNSVGNVTMNGIDLAGTSDITTDVGEVSFTGTLPPQASLDITARVGKVVVELPRDAAFTFDGQADIGQIRMDFDLNNREGGKRGITGTDLRGSTGANPTARLTIRTNTGEIDVRQR